MNKLKLKILSNSKALAAIIGIFSLALFFYFFVKNLDSISRALRELTLTGVGLAVLAFTVSELFKIFRNALLFREFEGLRLAARPVVKMTALHQIVFLLAPSGLGDAAFPWAAKRLGVPGLSAGVRILLIQRSHDLVLILVMTLLAVRMVNVGSRSYLVYILALISLSGPALFALTRGVPLISRVVGGLDTRRIFSRWFEVNSVFADSVSFGTAAQLSACSIAIWTSVTLGLLIAMQDLGLTTSFPEAALYVAGINIIGLVAKLSPGGLGIAEGGLASLMVLTGYSTDAAVTAAFSVRPLVLVFSLIAPFLLGAAAMLPRMPRIGTRNS